MNKVIIITGGANGIGLCTANEFKKLGAKVYVIDIVPGDHFVGDIGDKETLERFADKVIEEVGGLAKFVDSLIPGYVINSFSIPGGSMTKKYKDYVYSGTYDGFSYENKGVGTGFPYDLKKFAGTNFAVINATPFGNTFTFDAAKAGFTGEQLATDSITDFLTISLSSPDYIGHTFGPNSIEAEDCYLRLDKDLGNFLDFLDEKAGKGQYLLFLSIP
jgi:hypothetical protein